MHIIRTTLHMIALSLLGVCGAMANPAPPAPYCAAALEFCGITHDRVFTQYRACCAGLTCVSHDHIERSVTDVRCG
ncbi:hypothetical protein B0H10DRAFT_2231156 [Mycena sp. CBHHK59/15]|nr:hypothetical protein B0H10DRAFT_2231156 [Mycena sp. CBHHK59/15]